MARAITVLAMGVLAATADIAVASGLPQKRLVRRYEPYRGWTEFDGSTTYAIPATIVECESHGMVHEQTHPYSSSGLYQIELSSWAAYGGRVFASFPYLATKLQQSIIARRIWLGQGAAAWTCAWITGWL